MAPSAKSERGTVQFTPDWTPEAWFWFLYSGQSAAGTPSPLPDLPTSLPISGTRGASVVSFFGQLVSAIVQNNL